VTEHDVKRIVEETLKEKDIKTRIAQTIYSLIANSCDNIRQEIAEQQKVGETLPFTRGQRQAYGTVLTIIRTIYDVE